MQYGYVMVDSGYQIIALTVNLIISISSNATLTHLFHGTAKAEQPTAKHPEENFSPNI